jgi:putative transposase
VEFNRADFHRRSIRLNDFDYSQPGVYFVTICTRKKELIFESKSELRDIVERRWLEIPKRFPHVSLDAFIVMPNQIHAVIIVRATLAVALPESKRGSARPAPAGVGLDERYAKPAPTPGDIVGAFESR